ncbi:hypothetical protein ACAW74_23505 [Fibrella sp. WM1]|uniref:hypothetical protein n=1 Tax=Fibrella musci TaxID=3242485 RepID=UPI003521B4C7
MTRIIWKEGKVISIRTRGENYVLAQMGIEPYLIIFKLFSKDDKWVKIRLDSKYVLFSHPVTRQFLKKSTINEQKHIDPLKDFKLPTRWIKEDMSSRSVVIWPGTANQIELILFGEHGASLIEYDANKPGFQEEKIVMKTISLDDVESIESHELRNISIYPEFNERLYLCSQFGENVDPYKDLLFGRDLPLDYKKYFQIISGTVPLSELGY